MKSFLILVGSFFLLIVGFIGVSVFIESGRSVDLTISPDKSSGSYVVTELCRQRIVQADAAAQGLKVQRDAINVELNNINLRSAQGLSAGYYSDIPLDSADRARRDVLDNQFLALTDKINAIYNQYGCD